MIYIKTLAIIILFSAFLSLGSSNISANCNNFNLLYSACMSVKGDDPAASTLCTLEAGSGCSEVNRRQRNTTDTSTRILPNQPPHEDPSSNEGLSPILDQPHTEPQNTAPDQDGTSSEPPSQTVQTQETINPARRPYTPIKPVVPTITCRHEGNYFFPGQKRYECSSPRERGLCEVNAGYGVPFICDSSGNWGVGNDGVGECSTSCAPDDSTSYDQATCWYSQRRDDGQGEVCYAGTGAYGFNPPEGCNYSYGPLAECPIMPGDSSEEISYTPIPDDPIQENNCTGQITSACSEDGAHSLSASWSATPIQGEGTCNIFIRDGFGDHTISNDCSGDWSSSNLDGNPIYGDTNYELYVSNGIDSCLNAYVSNIQLSCLVVQVDNSNWGIIEPAIDWVEELF